MSQGLLVPPTPEAFVPWMQSQRAAEDGWQKQV